MSSPRSTPSRSSRRGAQRRGPGGDDTPSRRSTRSSRSTEPLSPPSQHAPLDSSPSGALAPLPSSPPSQEQRQNVHDTSLFSSPAASRAAASEIDLSSPLNYGTPSSRVGSTPRGSVAGTPRTRVRADIRSERKRREVNLASEAQGPPDGTEPSGAVTSDQPSGPQLVIWGTDVVVSHCKDKFKRFLAQYVVPSLDDDEMEGIDLQQPLYMQKLEEVAISAEPFLNVNCGHLKEFDANLYRQLICYPQEVIPTFDVAVNELFLEKFPDTNLEQQVQVRPYNVEKTTNMRNLNPEDIDQLITIGGMVIRTSNLVPEMMVAFFRCHVCHWTCTVEIDRGRIAEPTLCRNCSTQHSMALVHNRSQFGDKQMVKLQESPDDMPPGQTPNTTMVYAHNDLVDSVQPGDRVMVTGIYRATPLRPNPRQRNVKAVYKTHIDVIHFRKFDMKRLTEDRDGSTKISEDRMAELKELSQQGDIYERLARALAPSIYENEDIKKGILCQLFGGTKKDFTEAGRGKFRSDINILLCGDPGTSKSQLLQYVYKIMPRSQYTSGKGSSAVGLTAYITKDPETRQLVLQTGALVLSDNGVCCIDEFDKMNESTRSILHEVMEQQTLSIAKAGIICSLNARTSILAAANPVESQWNPKKNIIENLNLPHTLLSRFDLIFLILDPQDEIFDRRLANHLVSLYYRSPEEEEADEMDMSLLKDYISYARTNIQPKMSEEASQAFIHAYVEARKLGSGHGNVSAYPRQLESLIRLAEAHAKIRFSNVVELVDVEEAKRLHREALKQSATDPSTGVVDINILTTGMSDAARKRRQEIAEEIMKWWAANNKPRTAKSQVIYDTIRAATEGYLPRDLFDEGGHLLQEDGKVIRTGTTFRFT